MTEYRLAIKEPFGRVRIPWFAPLEFYTPCATLERAQKLKRLYEDDVDGKVIIIDASTKKEIK